MDLIDTWDGSNAVIEEDESNMMKMKGCRDR